MKGIPFIILLLFQLYLLNHGFYSISADEAGHTIEAYRFYKGGYPLFSIWLPFQMIFYALMFNIHLDLFWLPRILSMIFGHLTLLALMLLSWELFKSKSVVILTGIIGALFVGIAVFSVLPLTEIYFFFFLLISIYFLLKKSNWIYLTAPLMTTIRYEGWVFALIFAVILYEKH